MADVLSQNEIDALLSAVSSGEVETDEEVSSFDSGTGLKTVDWTKYDISSQEKLLKSRLVGLAGIHERFCRKFRATLLSLFGRNVSVTFRNMEMMKFGEFLTDVQLPTSFSIVQSKSPACSFVFVSGAKLTYALVDAYYGGNERPFSKLGGREEFTAIEKSLVKKAISQGCKDLMEAWRPNFPLDLNFQMVESNPHFVGAIHGSENVAVVSFEIEFETLSGPLVLVMPLQPLETLRKQLAVNITRELVVDEAMWKTHWEKEVNSLSLNIKCDLGYATKAMRELSDLKVGDTIVLDQDALGDLNVQVEGLTKLRGSMGAYRGSAAIKLNDIYPFDNKETTHG